MPRARELCVVTGILEMCFPSDRHDFKDEIQSGFSLPFHLCIFGSAVSSLLTGSSDSKGGGMLSSRGRAGFSLRWLHLLGARALDVTSSVVAALKA